MTAITFTGDGKVLVNGEDLNKRYPGYCWRSSSRAETEYVNDADPKDLIIEAVTGSSDGDSGVVTIRGSDVRLYNLLQIENPWRFHPVLGIITAFKLAVISFVLFVVQLLVGTYLLSIEGPDLRILALAVSSLALSALEVFILLHLWRKGQWRLGIIRILVHVVRHTVSGEKNLQYYRNLFREFSGLVCKDKARTALAMCGVMKFLS